MCFLIIQELTENAGVAETKLDIVQFESEGCKCQCWLSNVRVDITVVYVEYRVAGLFCVYRDLHTTTVFVDIYTTMML